MLCISQVLYVVHRFDRFCMLYIDLTGFMCCTFIWQVLYVVH